MVLEADVLVVFTVPVSCKTSSVTTRFVFLLTVCGTFPAQLDIENFGRIYMLVLRAPGCENGRRQRSLHVSR